MDGFSVPGSLHACSHKDAEVKLAKATETSESLIPQTARLVPNTKMRRLRLISGLTSKTPNRTDQKIEACFKQT